MWLFKDQNIELKGRKDEEWNGGELSGEAWKYVISCDWLIGVIWGKTFNGTLYDGNVVVLTHGLIVCCVFTFTPILLLILKDVFKTDRFTRRILMLNSMTFSGGSRPTFRSSCRSGTRTRTGGKNSWWKNYSMRWLGDVEFQGCLHILHLGLLSPRRMLFAQWCECCFSMTTLFCCWCLLWHNSHGVVNVVIYPMSNQSLLAMPCTFYWMLCFALGDIGLHATDFNTLNFKTQHTLPETTIAPENGWLED